MKERREVRWLLLAGLLLSGCGEDPVEPDYELRMESEHFLFLSNPGYATMSEMEQGLAIAEELYVAISAIVPIENSSRGDRIRVYLDGSARYGDPHCDDWGWIHLFRYSAATGGYFTSLAHELTHSLRWDYWQRTYAWDWPWFGYFEEGFAEFVAMSVYSEKRGFPFYGYPEDVVVGQWLAREEHIPMTVLRARHEDLNTLCNTQAYAQRASWFRFVDETYGRKAVLDLAYPEVDPTAEWVIAVVGVGPEELDEQWAVWQLARYAAYPDADARADVYRDFIRESYLCRAGVDY
jgi:hypothetical protein